MAGKGGNQSPHVDWSVVESAYRTGIKTLRQIAQENGITHGAVNKRAKRDAWERSPLLSRPKPAKVVLSPAPMDEMETSGFIYVIYIDNGVERFYKIGLAKNFSSRFGQHQCSSPFEICVALCYFTDDMRLEEKSLHAAFAEKRVRGEWFRLNDGDLKLISSRSLLV